MGARAARAAADARRSTTPRASSSSPHSARSRRSSRPRTGDQGGRGSPVRPSRPRRPPRWPSRSGSGNARCSTARQELASQLNALARADCKRIFSEKISTRVKTRPELEKALKLAYDIKEAAPTKRSSSPSTSSSALPATPPS
ncbi:recombinase family protein [Streptomyces sp. NBC_00024]|uniref:recombinase family protein n=1 Tax=Streptomyces sp. NBC_00024 TaxID=2903612 RepID=UPI003244C721